MLRVARNVTFVLLILCVRQVDLFALGAYYDLLSNRDCAGPAESDSGFSVDCEDSCDTSSTGAYEAYYFEVWSACLDYCEHGDYPNGPGAKPECQDFNGDIDLNLLDPGCAVNCNCFCWG